MKEKLAIIIPTKDRPHQIKMLLGSVDAQETRPVQIIIVDASKIPLDGIQAHSKTLNIVYVRKTPASLTAQRNEGIKALSDEATLVAFMDDDIVLEEDALKNMMAFWEDAAADIAGAAFNNTTDEYKNQTFMERIFLVNAPRPGRVLVSGFLSKICSLSETTDVQWLAGYAMVYRRSVFNEFMFDEWFRGYGRYEDVDFSYAVGRRYALFVVADAKVRHLNSLEDASFSFTLGKTEVMNRLYFVAKHKELSIPLCYWALLGLFCNNIIKSLSLADIRYIRRACGNAAGLVLSPMVWLKK